MAAAPPYSSSSSIQVPLAEPESAELDRSLGGLERFLRFFGFCQYSPVSTALFWLGFAGVGVIAPVLVVGSFYCSDCEHYQIMTFELEILASQTLTASISLICISHNLRKYGVRTFLFVDSSHGPNIEFSDLYVRKIRAFYHWLIAWGLICLILKAAREVTLMVYLHHGSWWQSVAILFVMLLSWTFSTAIFLSGTALFNLVSSLQMIHFENYGKVLEKDMDVLVYIEEHMRLTHNLSKISHRFRVFLLLEFLIVTASQFVALLQTTENIGIINFINAGDFAVLSIVQLVGIVVCLNAATKISHRAQGLTSVASRWHALVTCTSNDGSQYSLPTNGVNLDIPNPMVGSLPVNYSESDLESTDYAPLPANIQLTSHMSYHKRQSFVTYVHSNTGGFTIYGWTIDRHLVNTIFFIELSLVFFVLGKTVTVTVRH